MTTRRVAIKHDAALVDADGHVVGHDAGSTLVRRLLRVFPGAELIGPGPRRCEGFDLIPLEFVDPVTTVIINMDVLDSVDVWRTLRPAGAEPRLMNFVWWPTTTYPQPVEQYALALSCALFPTFANSERTATEVREVVARYTVSELAEKAKVAWVNLGFRLDHVRPRQEPTTPLVLYPAIYVSERKQPRLFLEVVERVHDQVPIRVSNGGGATYYEGSHSLLDNPFLQAMLISHMFGGWGGRYSTPHTRVVYLNNYRDTYRRTPSYSVQKAANKSFATRFKQDQAGNVSSRRGFSGGTSGTKRRSWTGGSGANPGAGDATESHPRRTWGGRRSSSSSGSSSRRSGYGR